MKKILLLSLLSVSVFSQTSNIFEPIDVNELTDYFINRGEVEEIKDYRVETLIQYD